MRILVQNGTALWKVANVEPAGPHGSLSSLLCAGPLRRGPGCHRRLKRTNSPVPATIRPNRGEPFPPAMSRLHSADTDDILQGAKNVTALMAKHVIDHHDKNVNSHKLNYRAFSSCFSGTISNINTQSQDSECDAVLNARRVGVWFDSSVTEQHGKGF